MDDLTPWLTVALLAMGLGAGTYGVLIGAGGGFIIAPLLIVVFDVDHEVAVGTSLVTVFLASTSGAASFLRLRQVDLRAAMLFSAAAIPGAVLGVVGLSHVPSGSFQIIYGVILVALGVYIILQPRLDKARDPDTPRAAVTNRSGWWSKVSSLGTRTSTVVTAQSGEYSYTYNEPMAVLTNGAFGFTAGFFGMGGGPLRTPALVYLFHFPMVVAVSTSVVSQVLFTAIGSAAHAVDNNVEIVPALLIGTGMIVGAQIAVRTSRRFRPRGLMRLLSLALLGIGAQLIVSGVG